MLRNSKIRSWFDMFLVVTPTWRRSPILTNISQVESNHLLESDQCFNVYSISCCFREWWDTARLPNFGCPAHSQIHSDTNLDLWLPTLTWGPIIMCIYNDYCIGGHTTSIELKLPFYQICQRIRTQHQLEVDAANQNSDVDGVLDSNRWHRCFPLSKELLCFIPRS